MRVVIFGATGFVGWAVLHEALAAPDVSEVVVVGRTPVSLRAPRLREVIVPDLDALGDFAADLSSIDACFWCLGISSQGMEEEAYTRITYTYAVNAAKLLGDLNPGLGFLFVSGEGADGKAMWARVKKRTEDALLSMANLRTAVLRPAFIRASHGARLRGRVYRLAYGAMFLLSPVLRACGWATSGAEIGRAMIVATRESLGGQVLTSRDLNQLARRIGLEG